MAMRLTGMYSGLDTETIIKELVKAKSAKVDSYKRDKTKLEWRQEAWTSLNSKVKSFFSGSLSNLRLSTAYKKKTTAVSNSSAVSVITGDKAMNGVLTLSVDKLAKTGYMTGAKAESKDGSKVTGETLVKDLKHSADTENALSLENGGSFTVTVNGKATKIEINDETTVSNVVKKLNEAGINANFDEGNGRIYLSASESGEDYDFTLTADNMGGFSALSFLGINAVASSDPNSANAKTATEYARLAAFESELTDKIKYVNDNPEEGIDYEATMANIDVESDLYKAIKEGMGDDDNFEAGINAFKEKVEMAAKVTNGSVDASLYSSASRIAGSNSQITLNGVTYTGNTNSIEVNGLTFNCLGEASNITVTTKDDTDGIYDEIKKFIKEFNEIIKEIDKNYNTKKEKGFEPLTDDEKDAMSDKDIEKWEQKIKDSILSRDTTLSSLGNVLKQAMREGFEVDGETLYLSSFGIETLSYFNAADNEKNVYHIAGDPDDNDTKGNADKLKSAIATDPERVISFFTQLTRNVYKQLDTISANTTDTTKGSFYEDKKYKNDLSSIESKIKDAEDKLAKYEDKYYAKFSRMEVALSKLESSTNSLVSMLGMNN